MNGKSFNKKRDFEALSRKETVKINSKMLFKKNSNFCSLPIISNCIQCLQPVSLSPLHGKLFSKCL